MKNNWLIIDGNSIAHYVFFRQPVRKKDEQISIVEGLLQFVLKCKTICNCDKILVLFEEQCSDDRKEKNSLYKENFYLDMKQLEVQIEKLKEDLDKFGISFQSQKEENMDWIASFVSKNSEEKIYVLTRNQMMLQLVSEEVSICLPSCSGNKLGIQIYDLNFLEEQFQVRDRQLTDLFSLIGIENAGIVGVDGIGRKKVIDFIGTYGSLDGLYAEIEQIKSAFYQEHLKEAEVRVRKNREVILPCDELEIELSDTCGNIPSDFEEKCENLLSDEIVLKIENSESWEAVTQYKENTMNMVGIANKQQLDALYVRISEHITKCESIGLCLTMEEQEVHHAFSAQGKYKAEAGGQLSLFDVMSENLDKSLCSCCFAFNDIVYYVDAEQEWFQEEYFANQLLTWIENRAIFDVLDGKKYLYTLHVLFAKYGLDTEIIGNREKCILFDLSVAQYLIDPNQEEYGYAFFAKKYFNLDMQSEKEYLGKKLWKQKKEEDATYATFCSQCAYLVKKCKESLLESLEQQGMRNLYEQVELPLVYVLYEMEKRGIHVNKEELKAYGDKLAVRITELEQIIYDLAEEEFNINSPKQLGVILFEKMGLTGAKKTKTGYSTSAEVLEKLKSEHEIVAYILEYRQLTKLKSTYADGLAGFINEEDGRIHCKFNQTITATGRLSSTEPNLQNIPIRMEIGREIRKVFVPKDGYVFLDADYSQIELRLLAHMSGDQSLIDAYNSGKDIHRITASQVFRTPFEEVTPLQRSNAKAVNFGIVYGISSFGLGQDLNISRKEAEEYIENYFETYPTIKKYLDQSVEVAKEHGYAVSLLGRRRPIPELASGNKYLQRAFGERIAMNSPIQGTAADIMKIAMIHVNDEMKKQKLKSQLLLQIHDELLVETYPDEIAIVKKILEEEMANAIELAVPLDVDVKEGKNWNEAH